MEQLGIATGADLQTPEFLTRHFGKSGAWYWRIARASTCARSNRTRARKSMGTGDTFLTDILLDPAQARAGWRYWPKGLAPLRRQTHHRPP